MQSCSFYSYIVEVQNSEFEEYIQKMEICSDLEKHFKNGDIKAYPGRRGHEIVLVAFPLGHADISSDDLKAYSSDHHKVDIVSGLDNDKENDIDIEEFLDQENIYLSAKSSANMQGIIEKHSDFLMSFHSNLFAIETSAIKIKDGQILKEECIVLCCTGKGIMPLLEEQFPRKLGDYNVDVRQEYYSFVGNKYEKKLNLGWPIGHNENEGSGTLGPIFREQKNSIPRYGFLTCSHVLFEEGYLKENENSMFTEPQYQILQPPDLVSKIPVEMRRCGHVVKSFIGNVNNSTGVDVSYVQIENEDRKPSEMLNGKLSF